MTTVSQGRQIAKHPLLVVVMIAALGGVIVFLYLWFRFSWPLWALISLILIGILLLIFFIQALYSAQWAGFKDKKLWDWLNLLGILAVPLILGLATLLFTAQQAQSALDQQRATILLTYIDNIQDLMLNHNLLGDSPKPKTDAERTNIQEIQVLARARTLAALEGLDPDRKARLVLFLFEAHLIGFLDSSNNTQYPIIDFAGTDLSGANFNEANLNGVNLSCANFDADSTYIIDHNCVNLGGVNFHLALLNNANFSDDTFDGADLSFASLNGSNLEDANLEGAHLRGADLTRANLFRANLSKTYLDEANMSYAHLSGANLNGANLSDANFNGANLEFADLSGADGLTQDQLDLVYSCK